MEDYKRKLELAKERYNSTTSKEEKEFIESLFPELKKSENERIRKEIINFLKENLELGRADKTWNSKNIEIWINWIEKQGEQKLCMIQWKGDNLKEVIDFTGKNKNFDKWFTSFEEYERYVHEHNNIFKLFNEDGSHYEVPVGAWIVKTPDGYNVASKAVLKQKPADKVEPKFRVGDWVRAISSGNIFKILSVNDGLYRMLCYDGVEANYPIEDVDYDLAYWAIQDAKDGDVLAYPDGTIVLFKYRLDGLNSGIYMSHILLATKIETCQSCAVSKDLHPATKEQRDLLFQKMKEAGYEWDAEKKELKKIEQSCYHNDGLYYAIDILEKTLGKVEGYQSDDGKMEHQIAIETVNALYHKKPTWSEEDENIINGLLSLCEEIQDNFPQMSTEFSNIEELKDWLKSLKDKVQPQPTSEWSEEDEEVLNNIITAFKRIGENCEHYFSPDTAKVFEKTLKSLKDKIQPKQEWSEDDIEKMVKKRALSSGTTASEMTFYRQGIEDTIKSLKSQPHWKPSEYDISLLEEIARNIRNNVRPFCSEVSSLENLINDLKKL